MPAGISSTDSWVPAAATRSCSTRRAWRLSHSFFDPTSETNWAGVNVVRFVRVTGWF
jgi:hypothetical protein